eukprot:CAMPEP_0172603036 /NCGR_PEP_ID=MMETSP1068-20121228/23230_1 /TAXON_ID=35684 /ORGANISM="Pseudopedinella elastica, Strain CCMP716" /LENGTH=117 /DNA_ID=CAMNT_0013404615 /DNA_START=148 /DNA_END=501 /DNA_ORIENTATION=+
MARGTMFINSATSSLKMLLGASPDTGGCEKTEIPEASCPLPPATSITNRSLELSAQQKPISCVHKTPVGLGLDQVHRGGRWFFVHEPPMPSFDAAALPDGAPCSCIGLAALDAWAHG